MNANNPLLLPWTGPMAGAPPLDEVTTPLLEAALEAAMLAEDEELARLRNVDGPSTFENTVKVLDGLGDDLDRVVSIYSNFCLSFSTPELRALRRVMQPRLSARRDDLYGDNTLFERIRVISRDDGLNPEQQRLCQRLLERFEDAGAHLDEATRAKVAQVNQRLSSLYSEFSDRVLADEEELVTWLDEDALTGMAESWISAARETATIHGRPEAWAVANTRSAVEPYLGNSMSEPARENAQALYGELWDEWQARVKKARPQIEIERVAQTPAAWVTSANGDLAVAAKDAGLVDELGSWTDFGARVAEIAGEDAGEQAAFWGPRADLASNTTSSQLC